MSDPLWIKEADAASLIDMQDAIEALEAGLAEEAAGLARNMVKTHVLWGHSTLHAIGAVFERSGYVGGKIWAHTEGGATPLLIMYDAKTGGLKAIVEAFVLGQLRTGGISGVATKLMSNPASSTMAMIGTGKQSAAQIAAVAAVRPITRVLVWSPTEASRNAFAEKVSGELGLDVRAAPTLEAAVGDADVVTVATRATSPFLTSSMLKAGAHLNAVGAITPERSEYEPGLMKRAAVVAADSTDQVRRLSAEFRSYYGTDEKAWESVRPLSSLVGAAAPRPTGDQITIFKAMGMGISDLSLGIEIHRRAIAAGLGRPIEPPRKAAPRLTRNSARKVADHV